jgi:serine/threonine protein kinase/tetratricopeptide (TPR) repeat protein
MLVRTFMSRLESHARSIFLGALEYQGPEIDEFVNAACGADPELRGRVDELLNAHRDLGSINDRLDVSPSPASRALPLEGPGTIIGPYRLLEQIGEGGFGIVYMAEQSQPVRRKIALKIIKPGMDTRLVVARFEAERQALALMDHPNIAQVFDGGATDTGRPYFVMELVRGIPITEFCDQNRLPVNDRVELFVTVCRAVQHAHQKGIIHRDLKPSNVLVTMHDDKPVVKVIDFGVAKAVGQQLTEKTLFTNFAQMIGTPLYMSPEQAQISGLDVDTRSDVYAMGVLLYELLTGTTPFDRERLRTVAFDEIRRIIREEEPPRPSTRLNTTNAATTTASLKRGSDPRRLRQILRGELDWIVMKCLEKDRNRRYATANGLAADLVRYLKHEPVQACPPSLAYRLRVFARRHRASIGTAALLLAVALMGGAITIRQSFRAAAAQEAAIRAQLALSENRGSAAIERARAIAHDLETLNLANSLIDSGRNHLDFSEWARAEADINQALALRRDHSSAWVARGEVYARLNLWDLAAADYQQAYALAGPGSARSLYLHALLRLYGQDEAGYRKVCELMIKKFDDPQDPRSWEKEEVARACLLAPAAALPPERLVLLTRRAVDSRRSFPRVASLATALYRAGHYDLALEHLQDARTNISQPETVWTNSVEAMIRQRRGEPDLARLALQSAASSLGERFQSRSNPPGPSSSASWWLEIQGELFFREASMLVEGKPPKDDPRKWVMRGTALETLHRYDEAIASYSRAIELNPDDTLVLALRALLYDKKGDWPNLFKDFERRRALGPDNGMFANDLAWFLGTCPDLRYRDQKRAVELAELAVKLVPSAANFWNTLGVVRYRASDWAGSVDATLNSMKLLNAKILSDWFILAMAQWQLGEKSRAKQLLSHAERRLSTLSLQKTPLMEFRNEARALFGMPGTVVTPADETAPDDPSAYTLLLEIAPGTPWVYGLRASACLQLKQWDQAAADLARVTDKEPRNAECWYGQAICRLAAGDLSGYRKARAGILANFRNDKNAVRVRHVTYASAVAPATPEEAEALLAMANVAVAATPTNPRVRGAVNFRAGRFEAAIADLEQSARVYPRRAWDWLFLAMAHQKLDHADLANRSFKKALDWIERANRTLGTGSQNPWTGWFEPVEVEQLRKEAADLIQAAAYDHSHSAVDAIGGNGARVEKLVLSGSERRQ